MTNEFRIAAMIFGLSISAASAQDMVAGEASYRNTRPELLDDDVGTCDQGVQLGALFRIL